MRVPWSRDGGHYGLLREQLMHVAEADIRSAYGEAVERPQVDNVDQAIYAETVKWVEGNSDFAATFLGE